MAEITTLYKYGFTFKGVTYGWKNKKLYRLPHTKNSKSYSILEIKFYCFRSTTVANIQKTKLTINRIKGLTKEINISLSSIVDEDLLF
jgi:hypothetical protein